MPTAWLILMNSRLSAGAKVSNSVDDHEGTWGRHTLGAAAHEQGSLTDKVLGDVSKFLEGVRHCGWNWGVMKERKERKERRR